MTLDEDNEYWSKEQQVIFNTKGELPNQSQCEPHRLRCGCLVIQETHPSAHVLGVQRASADPKTKRSYIIPTRRLARPRRPLIMLMIPLTIYLLAPPRLQLNFIFPLQPHYQISHKLLVPNPPKPPSQHTSALTNIFSQSPKHSQKGCSTYQPPYLPTTLPHSFHTNKSTSNTLNLSP